MQNRYRELLDFINNNNESLINETIESINNNEIELINFLYTERKNNLGIESRVFNSDLILNKTILQHTTYDIIDPSFVILFDLKSAFVDPFALRSTMSIQGHYIPNKILYNNASSNPLESTKDHQTTQHNNTTNNVAKNNNNNKKSNEIIKKTENLSLDYRGELILQRHDLLLNNTNLLFQATIEFVISEQTNSNNLDHIHNSSNCIFDLNHDLRSEIMYEAKKIKIPIISHAYNRNSQKSFFQLSQASPTLCADNIEKLKYIIDNVLLSYKKYAIYESYNINNIHYLLNTHLEITIQNTANHKLNTKINKKISSAGNFYEQFFNLIKYLYFTN